MSYESLIDSVAARLQVEGILIGRIDEAPWIDEFESHLPQRLSPSFASLVRRYTFRPFEWGRIRFFGNSGTDDELDLVVGAVRDRAISRTTLGAGLVHFARAAGFSYDPICFDTRTRRKSREFPIVRLDHEAILIKNRIDVLEQVAPSFSALLESLLASHKDPIGE